MREFEQDHEHDFEWLNDLSEPEEQWSDPPDKHRFDSALAWTHKGLPIELGFRQSHEEMLRARFNELANQWRKDIGYKSSLRRIVFNRAYLAIMLMAVDDDRHRRLITRFILEELRDRGGHWFWALHAITGANPAGLNNDFDAVRDAWMQWGKTHGYLED